MVGGGAAAVATIHHHLSCPQLKPPFSRFPPTQTPAVSVPNSLRSATTAKTARRRPHHVAFPAWRDRNQFLTLGRDRALGLSSPVQPRTPSLCRGRDLKSDSHAHPPLAKPARSPTCSGIRGRQATCCQPARARRVPRRAPTTGPAQLAPGRSASDFVATPPHDCQCAQRVIFLTPPAVPALP